MKLEPRTILKLLLNFNNFELQCKVYKNIEAQIFISFSAQQNSVDVNAGVHQNNSIEFLQEY